MLFDWMMLARFSPSILPTPYVVWSTRKGAVKHRFCRPAKLEKRPR